MKESLLQTQIKRSFDMYCEEKGIEGHYHKIVDAGFTNPYDCYILTDLGFTAIEAKVNRQKTRFNFKQLFGYGKQYHEITTLKRVANIGHGAFVVVAHRMGSQFRAYALRPNVADEYYHRGSVSLEEVQANSIELPRKHRDSELLYALSPILG